jgi:hypothetical protein
MSRTHRTARRGGALGLASALLLLALSGPSAQASGRVDCVGPAGVDYSPPLTLVAQRTSAMLTANLACVSLTHPTITSATATADGSGVLSCSNPFAASGTGSISWSTGASSLFSFTTAIVFGPGTPTLTLTLTGSIVSGLFAGLAVQVTAAFPFNTLACATTGIASLSGSARLVVL